VSGDPAGGAVTGPAEPGMRWARLDGPRVAEVLVTCTDGRDVRGSGYWVRDHLVLTAAHVVADPARVAVRFGAGQSSEWSTAAAVEWRDESADLALLRLEHVLGGEVVPVRFGRVKSRPVQVEAHMVGFPRWKLRPTGDGGWVREAHHAVGTVAALSNTKSGTLEITIEPPGEDPDPAVSPWQAMSGAAVWIAGCVVGVVSAHHRREGLGRLTAVRLDRYLQSPGEVRDALAELLDLSDGPDALVDVLAVIAIRGGNNERTELLGSHVGLVSVGRDKNLNTVDNPVSFSASRAAGPEIGELRPHAEALDFKFINRGDAAAVLHEFTIRVVDFELDVTPRLMFFAQPSEPQRSRIGTAFRALAVQAHNSGWGDAVDCDYRLQGPWLERIFPADTLQFYGTVGSGVRKDILTLAASSLLLPPFREIVEDRLRFVEAIKGDRGEYRRSELLSLIERLHFSSDAGNKFFGHLRGHLDDLDDLLGVTRLPIDLKVLASHRSVRGELFVEEYQVFVQGDTGPLWVSPSGFFAETNETRDSYMYSDRAYAVVLEPYAGYEKRYSISRIIKSGDADRFHIVLSAPKSGSFKVQVEFSIDEGLTVASPHIDLRFECPAGKAHAPALPDAAEFRVIDGRLQLGGSYVSSPHFDAASAPHQRADPAVRRRVVRRRSAPPPTQSADG
jgi:hypothetical protein